MMDMTRSKPGINIETPRTKHARKILEKTLEFSPYFDLSQLDSSTLTG
jgi:hypothetical protein